MELLNLNCEAALECDRKLSSIFGFYWFFEETTSSSVETKKKKRRCKVNFVLALEF